MLTSGWSLLSARKELLGTINILLIRQIGLIRKVRQKNQRQSRIYQHSSDPWAYCSVILSTLDSEHSTAISSVITPTALYCRNWVRLQ